MRILHLMSDDKFIDSQINKFSKTEFDNVFLYIKDKNTYSGRNADIIIYVKPFSKEYDYYIENSNTFDGIVTNGLGYFQSVFINKLPITIKAKIFLRFFGAEIYHNPQIWKKEFLYTPETLNAIRRNYKYFFLQKIYHIRFYLKNRNNIYNEIKKALSKCDYFLWYLKEEYQMISNQVEVKLPVFKFLSIDAKEVGLNKTHNKKNRILLGNSGSESNNHLTILELFHKVNCSYEIIIPLSYGLKSWYKKEIIKRVKEYNNLTISLLSSFVPYDQYMLNFENARAAVYPSYRQMGLGNILMCIQSGVKIYLSERNPTHEWFNNINIKVYSIELDLEKDILANNLRLDEETVLKNKIEWNRLIRKQTSNEFVEMMKSLFSTKKTG